MSSILRTLALAVAAPAVAGVALAGIAHADPPLLNGAYVEADGDPLNVWTIATNCSPSGCTGTVSSNTGWSSPTTFTGGRWVFTVTKPGGLTCDNGTYAPAVTSMSVDPVTLAGVLSSDSNYGCDGGTVTTTAFQLNKVG